MNWFWQTSSAPDPSADSSKRSAARGRRAQFGPYQLDTLTEELWKDASRVRLQSQPFRILVLLISNPHELVTRESIRAAIWPEESSLGFDNSINASMNKLRAAIEDSAQSPRYIETLSRRGYRFIGAVEWTGKARGESPANASAGIFQRLKGLANEWKWQVLLASVVLGLLAALLVAQVRLLS